jgi:hypothetical protein
MILTKNHYQAIEAIKKAVDSPEFQSKVRANIERENQKIAQIEASIPPSSRQYTQVYNI